jgi:hypothetical protein
MANSINTKRGDILPLGRYFLEHDGGAIDNGGGRGVVEPTTSSVSSPQVSTAPGWHRFVDDGPCHR